MRLCIVLVCAALVVLVSASPGQEAPPVPVVRLAAQQKQPPVRALQYRLLPDPQEQQPGNAAPFWLRASLALRSVPTRFTDTQYQWTGPAGTPLKDLPRKEVRDFLKNYEQALQLAEEASRRWHCDWEMPPLTLQNMNRLPLESVQSFRELAQLLSVKVRLEMAEGKFEQCLATLQVGLALARNVGNSDTVIENLVGIAIGSIMLSHVEEMIQQPGSPNLYWALSALPNPFIDIRRSFNAELNSWYRSFPQLRQVTRKPLSVEEVNRLADDFTRSLAPLELGGELPGWSSRLGLTAITLKLYPDARQYLLNQGRKREEVEALPTFQVVVIYLVDQYDAVRDGYLKWLNLPSWQMWQGIQEVEQAWLKNKDHRNNPLITLLLPALSKTVQAQLRQQFHLAGLRGAEALRLYAAGHNGQAPEKWSDIKEVPPPLNPFTGQGLDANYHFQDGQGTLEIMPLRGVAQVGRRYITPARK